MQSKLGDKALSQFTSFIINCVKKILKMHNPLIGRNKRLIFIWMKWKIYLTIGSSIIFWNYYLFWVAGKRIQRGFSLNKNLLKQNMETLTVTYWRKIKDYLSCNKIKLNTYTIPSKILESVQLSQQKYEVYLQENKSNTKQDEKQKQIALIEEGICRINERIELVSKTVILKKLKKITTCF